MKKSILYAVGDRGWVQLRRSKRSPKIESKILTKKIRIEGHWDFWTDTVGPAHFIDDKVRIVTISGGRRVGNIKTRLFSKWTGHSLSLGTIWPLPEKMASEITKRVRALKRAG